jgi:hypothetical protein
MQDWEGVELRVVAYKASGTHIIGGTDDVQALLDDQIVKVQVRACETRRPGLLADQVSLLREHADLHS